MKLVDVARQSETVAAAGRRGCGKTMLIALRLYIKYLKGCHIYSNTPLSFPYKRIHTLKDIEMIYYDDSNWKCLFLDDIERILHARNYKMNKSLNEILLDFGKIGCDLEFTSKGGPLSEGKYADVELRDAVDTWLMPEIVLRVHSKNPIVEAWLNTKMNFKKMNIAWIDGTLTDCGMLKPINNLLPLCGLYQTKEKVKPLEVTDNSTRIQRTTY